MQVHFWTKVFAPRIPLDMLFGINRIRENFKQGNPKLRIPYRTEILFLIGAPIRELPKKNPGPYFLDLRPRKVFASYCKLLIVL
jgi:hypothetical protein